MGLAPTGIWDEATDAAMRVALGEYATLLSETTADIQRLLADLGFYTGPIDGVWTEEVTDAVKALQRELGVPETGVLDAATLQAAYTRGLSTGSTAPPETTVPPTATVPPETTAPPATTVPETTVPPTTVPPVTAPPETTVPPEPPLDLPTLLEALDDAGYTTFAALLRTADFDADFAFAERYTLFPPTDAAFEDAGVSVDDFVGKEVELATLLADHAVEGEFTLEELAALLEPDGTLEMLSGNRFPVVVTGATVTLGGATLVRQPVLASNGIIHGLESLYTS